jgi:alanine dehydrogenase
MLVGIPREIKIEENRVAITPAGVYAFKEHGHDVLIERDAGAGSGISDSAYEAQGAKIAGAPEKVFDSAELILKVKEPQPDEIALLRSNQVLFTYLHLAADKGLAWNLKDRDCTAIAYETVQASDGGLPLLKPMSEVAGRVAVQIGAHLLEKPQGGQGILLGGVPGVSSGHVVIIGGGIVGWNAAEMAIGLGARVTILDNNPERLRTLDNHFGGRVNSLISNPYNIAQSVQRADMLIGAVLIPGAKAPNLVTETMVKSMKPGSIILDVAIDQGGIVETMDHVTTHDDPIYIKHGVLHYAVANMPGIVPQTATYALTNNTLPYALELADQGFTRAVQNDLALAHGVNLHQGHCTHQAVAEAVDLKFFPLADLL